MSISSTPTFEFLEGIEDHDRGNPNSSLNFYEQKYGPDGWPNNDSDFDDYCYYAQLSGDIQLGEIVQERLSNNTGNVALDVAGGRNGVALTQLIDLGLIERGIVTNYLDRRNQSTQDDPRLTHVTGNLLLRQTWQEIYQAAFEQTKDGLALVMHRPLGALQKMDPTFYEGAAHALINLVRPGGLFFTQVPNTLYGNNLEAVANSIYDRTDIEKILCSPVSKTFFKSAVILKKW